MNIVDREFYKLAEQIGYMSGEEIFRTIKTSFEAMAEGTRKSYVNFFNAFGFWGKLDPEKGVYEAFDLKAAALKQHMTDFVWLYERLADFRSKRTLYTVLNNWFRLDCTATVRAKEYMFDEYFDLDILKYTSDEVVVDLGAYVGDTLLLYVLNFGRDSFKKYYCYEITPSTFEILRKNVVPFDNVECRLKGIADKKGVMRISENKTSLSANSLSEEGETEVEVTTLDEDVTEPVTLIKADIEGGEQNALRGAVGHINNDHPKLLVSVYHNNEDLWKIPQMIDGISTDYDFYLRYKGSLIYPTEITLFAL